MMLSLKGRPWVGGRAAPSGDGGLGPGGGVSLSARLTLVLPSGATTIRGAGSTRSTLWMVRLSGLVRTSIPSKARLR